TGLGIVAPNGIGTEAFWKGCVEGRSGVGPIQAFDASSLPVRVAAQVPDYDPAPYVPEHCRKSLKIMGRAARFGLTAAALGLEDSGLDLAREDPETVGVVMGSGLIPMDLNELAPLLNRVNDAGRLDWSRLDARGESPLFPLWLLKYLPNMAAAHVSMAF